MHLQIFVEIERARLTRKLAAIKEAEGAVGEAADILQVGGASATRAGRAARQQLCMQRSPKAAKGL